MFEEIKNSVEWLKKSGVTSYRINKETGISETAARKFLLGESDIENLRLGNVELLVELANKIKGETEMEKVTFEGIEYTLTQQAYITGTHENPYYEASAIDSEGNEVTVTWDIKEHWLNEDGALNGLLEDEGEACDWDNPVSVD